MIAEASELQPNEDTREHDHGQEATRGFLVAGGYAAMVDDAANEDLHETTTLVPVLVAGHGFPTVFASGDDRLGSLRADLRAQAVTVVAAIRHDAFGLLVFEPACGRGSRRFLAPR